MKIYNVEDYRNMSDTELANYFVDLQCYHTPESKIVKLGLMVLISERFCSIYADVPEELRP